MIFTKLQHEDAWQLHAYTLAIVYYIGFYELDVKELRADINQGAQDNTDQMKEL